MRCDFTVMDQHLEAPRGALKTAKLVLSRLGPGRSMIGAPAPSLKLVVEGEERYEVDGRTVCVRPGEFLYLDAGASCTGTNRAHTTGLCLILPSELQAEAPAPGHDPVLGRALVLSTATSRMGQALRDYGRRIARDPEIGGLLAGELAARVEQAIAEPLTESRAAIEALGAARQQTRRELYRRLERARGFLHDQDDRAVSLGELAGVAGLSQFHLARYFKLAFGRSPIAYHRGLRLARAAQFVAAGEGSLGEAALRTPEHEPAGRQADQGEQGEQRERPG
ncbi:MAG: hypothetical protein ACLGHC_10590 [Alphaproteobacteria bacterium]